MRIAWWTSVFPGLATTATVVAANLFGDGLNAVLNPGRQELPMSASLGVVGFVGPRRGVLM